MTPTTRLVPLILTALSSGAAAQEWITFDDSPAGTPAEVQRATPDPTTQATTIAVRIHGFWMEDVVGDDGVVYQRLEFPGLPMMQTPGSPELPEARALLGIATQSVEARLVSTEVLAQTILGGVRVYPAPIPGEDEEIDPSADPGPGDPNGTEEEFQIDHEVYTGTGVWPSGDGEDGAVEPGLGPVSEANVACWPVAWDQGANRLIVGTHVEFTFDHAGEVIEAQTITKLEDKLLSEVYLNWLDLGDVAPAEPTEYHARYLILADVQFWDELVPFRDLKLAQGYQVTLAGPPPGGVEPIRDFIADWYVAGDPGMDHYCLLVGDTNRIPIGAVVTSSLELVLTDDVYGTVGAVNASKEVYVGRLSVDDGLDLGRQLAKIIAYQTEPVPGGRYDTALLVANGEDYPSKYTASHLKVLNGSYAHPPAFLTAFGGTGATTTQVANFINAGALGDGLGLVAYRGHGSTNAWSNWNTLGEDFHKNTVVMLTNPVHPVVWSFACTNANINAGDFLEDSIAEVWLEADAGAVASYAATQLTSTTQNHFHNEEMFRVVYDQGITTHGLAVAAAEAKVWILWPGHKNPWAYLLLGDPSMIIRRDAVQDVVVFNMPDDFKLGLEPDSVSLSAIVGDFGVPLSDGLISFHKASFLQGEPAEMLGARWFDEQGAVDLPLELKTPGVLKVMARDLAGNVLCKDVPVSMGPAWTDLGEGLPGESTIPRLAGLGAVTPGSDLTVLLTGALPGNTAFVCAGPDAANLPLFGGTLVPNVFVPGGAVIPAVTDGNGNLQATSSWPASAQSGDSLYLQAWFLDPSGPAGFTATNAVVATTP